MDEPIYTVEMLFGKAEWKPITYAELRVGDKVIGPKLGEPWREITQDELDEATMPAWWLWKRRLSRFLAR